MGMDRDRQLSIKVSIAIPFSRLPIVFRLNSNDR